MGGWCKEQYNKDENNKLEGLHQKPDQMEETRGGGGGGEEEELLDVWLLDSVGSCDGQCVARNMLSFI